MSDGYVMVQAREVQDIGFVEYTRDLINGVFDAVLDAQEDQAAAYLDMVGRLTRTLEAYVADARDEVPTSELLALMDKVPGLLDALGGEASATEGDGPVSLSADVAGALAGALSNSPWGAALAGAGMAAAEILPALTGARATMAPVDVHKGKLIDALAEKLAADRYSMLQEMAKLGMARLVVENGQIETRMTFKAMEREQHKSKTREKTRDRERTRERARGPGRARERERGRYLAVNVAKTADTARTQASVEVYSRLVLNFRTDYQPVSQA